MYRYRQWHLRGFFMVFRSGCFLIQIRLVLELPLLSQLDSSSLRDLPTFRCVPRNSGILLLVWAIYRYFIAFEVFYIVLRLLVLSVCGSALLQDVRLLVN